MKRKTKVALVMATSLACGALAQRAQAQISLTTAGSGSYAQNFDTLANTGTTAAWVDNFTLPGWYMTKTNGNASYTIGTGSSNSGALYSFGAASVAERAMGSIGSGSTGTVLYGAQFQNSTGAGNAINDFTVGYTGEQWRDGGNTNGAAQTLFFEWSVDATSLTSGTWSAFNALDFVSPTHNALTAGMALDGNAAANRTVFAPTQVAASLNVAPGNSIWVRWRDLNDGGNDHGYGPDDFSFSYNTAPYSTSTRDLTWDSNAGTAGIQDGAGNWSDASNNFSTGLANVTWSSSNPDNAYFGSGAGAGSYTVAVTGAVTANRITFVAGSPNYTIGTPGSSNTVTISSLVANNSATLEAPVNLAVNQVWNVAGTSTTLTANGSITGQTLDKSGTGTLRLANTNNSMNGVQLDGGTLEISTDGNLGNASSQLLSNSGTIKFLAATTFPGPGGGIGGRTFNLGGATTFDTNGNDVEIAGDVIGGGTLTKVGNGVLTLSSPSESDAALRYNGAVNINGGAIRLNSQIGNFGAIGGGNTNINSGGTLWIDNVKIGIPTGSAITRVFINDGGTIKGTGQYAEYNRGSEALSVQCGLSAAPVNVTIATANASDIFSFGNHVRLGSTNQPVALDSSYNTVHVTGPGRVVLRSGSQDSTVTYRGDWSLEGGILQLGPINPGGLGDPINALGFRALQTGPTGSQTLTYDWGVSATINSGAMLALGVDKANPNATYNAYASGTAVPPPYLRNKLILNGGSMASTAYEVDSGGYQDPNQPVQAAIGGDLTVNSGSILLYNPIANPDVSPDDYLGPRNFNIVANGVTIWNGNLTVDPGQVSNTGASLNLNRTGGSVAVTAPSTITIMPRATVNLDGSNALSDGTNAVNIANGELLHARTGSHAVGSVTGAGNTTVDAGATLEVRGLDQTALTVDGRVNAKARGAGVNKPVYVKSLSLGAAGVLDLNDNDLVVQFGGGPNPFNDLRTAVFAGYSPSVDPSKIGIISSTGQSAGNTILALIDNSLVGVADWPLGSGHTIAGNSVIGKYTYFGDANVDGQVTSDDYAILDSNLNTTPADGIAWLSGDANLDGSVTADDYAILDSTLGSGVGNPLSPAAVSAVPEPASLGLLGLGLSLLARRRRSR